MLTWPTVSWIVCRKALNSVLLRWHQKKWYLFSTRAWKQWVMLLILQADTQRMRTQKLLPASTAHDSSRSFFRLAFIYWRKSGLLFAQLLHCSEDTTWCWAPKDLYCNFLVLLILNICLGFVSDNSLACKKKGLGSIHKGYLPAMEWAASLHYGVISILKAVTRLNLDEVFFYHSAYSNHSLHEWQTWK